MSLFMCMQLVLLGGADCAQEYAALFLGFAGTGTFCKLQIAGLADKGCRRWLLIIISLIFFPA